MAKKYKIKSRDRQVLHEVTPAEPACWSWREAVVPVLLALGAFLLYVRTLNADFLRWDDRQNILLNPWIENGIFKLIWTRPYYNMYIPVTYTLWTFLWHLDPQPWLFHLANILFHAGNTALVYLIARKFLRPDERLGAVFAALLFACHPLQVETVAWISTFRDTLACFFSLSGVYIVITRAGWPAMTAATVLFCVSLLCKPSVAVVPAAVLIAAHGFHLLTRARAVTLGIWFLPALAASYVTKRVQQLDADLRLAPMDLGDRLLVAVDTLSFYVQKLFFPYPLAADYGRTREIALDENLWVVGLLSGAAIAALIYFFRRSIAHRYYYYIGWFVLFLAPVLGIIPFQAQGQTTVADRYVYMSLIGPGLAFGALLGGRRLRWAGAAILAVLAVMTLSRTEVWRTNEVFFRDMLAKNKKSHVALSSLGVEFILSGNYVAAKDVLDRAAALRPTDVIPRTNLAQLYLLIGKPDLVIKEIVPLLNDKEFLRQNQTETRALASAYRLAGRAYWAMRQWDGGNDYFCRWFKLDYENEEGKAELVRFLEDAKRAGARLENCEAPLRQ